MKQQSAARAILVRSGVVIAVVTLITIVFMYGYLRTVFRDMRDKEIATVTEVTTSSVEAAHKAADALERSLENRLLLVSKAVAEELRGKPLEAVTSDELTRLKQKLAVHDISLFVRRGDDIVVAQSSDPKEIGLSSKTWGFWHTAFHQLLNGEQVTVKEGHAEPHFWAGPISFAATGAGYMKFAYYHDGTTEYIINPFVQETEIQNPGDTFGIERMIREMLEKNRHLAEVGIINVEPWLYGAPELITYPQVEKPVLYGTHDVRPPQADQLLSRVLTTGQCQTTEFRHEGRHLFVTYTPMENNRALAVTYDLSWQEATQLHTLLVLLGLALAAFLAVALALLLFSRREWRSFKLEEERLRIAEDFQRTISALPNAVFKATRTIDGQVITTYNEGRAAAEFGIRTEQVRGKPFAAFLGGEAYDAMRPAVEQAFAGEDGKALITLQGRTFETVVKPVAPAEPGAPIKEIAGFAVDITERLQAELELQRARDLAVQASQAKTNFLATMSHELRTPLAVILGMADVIEATPLSEEQRRYVSVCRTASDTMLSLINDILDLSRVEIGQLQLAEVPFPLDQLVENTVQMFRLKAEEKGISLTSTFGAAVPKYVVGDPQRVQQVLFNVVGNAVKFTEQGSVDLRVTLCPGTGALRFTVTDTGIGIPPEKLETIFDAFTQGDSSITRKYGGTGLGLAIVKRLIALMGGQLWVESRIGEGSTFSFTVPLEEAESAPPAVGRNEADPPTDERPLRILVAEDSEEIRFLIEAVLSHTGYQLDWAENGAAAVSKHEANEYDLVLMDIRMPVMDGLEATRRIRERERMHGRLPVPVLALTAHVTLEDVADCLAAGCSAHLAKPFGRVALMEAILRLTNRMHEEEKIHVRVDAEISSLLPQFFASVREDLERLARALSESDFETARTVGHMLKGSGGGYGFHDISDLGREIEAAATARDARRVAKLMNSLADYLVRIHVKAG